MIRKSGNRFSVATNAKRVRAEIMLGSLTGLTDARRRRFRACLPLRVPAVTSKAARNRFIQFYSLGLIWIKAEASAAPK
jgi:hypothetical protein